MKINHYLQFFCILLASILIFPYASSAADPYTVDNIAVTAKGNSATEASQTAITSAEKQAFTLLLERMGNTSIPALSSEEISTLVSGMEVRNEKITPGYYSAVVNISFNPRLVKDKLNTAGIQPLKELSDVVADAPKVLPKVLVLPLLANDQTTPVIDEHNAWYQAWKNIATNTSSYHLKLATSSDQFPLLATYLTTPNSALPQPDLAALLQEISALKKRYNVSFLYAATAYTTHTLESVETASYSVDLTNDTPTPSLLFPSDNDTATGIEHDYHVMSGQINNYISKEIAKHMSGTASELFVIVPITHLNQWIEIKNQLSRIDLIEQITIDKLSSSQATLRLYYSTSYSILSKRLQEASFSMSSTANGIILTKTSSPLQPRN